MNSFVPNKRVNMARFLCLFIYLLIVFVEGESSSNLNLKMANVLYRHGDRSPVNTFPIDEHKNYWKQGFGQLTEKGMKQEFEMGKFLKNRYVGSLINGTYLRKEVYCRSSDKDRTLMSAEAQMAGLYPPKLQKLPKDKNWELWQLIPIHTVPKEHDKLLRPTHDCPKYQLLQNKSFSDPKFVAVNQKYKEFIYNVSRYVGLKKSLALEKIHKVHDMLFCQHAHNLSLPKWATPEVMNTMQWLYDFNFEWLFNTVEKSRLTGGVLLGEMIKNMKNFVKNSSTSKKLNIYSAHDTTVVALLSALKLYSGIPPPYSTTFLMELYQDTKSKEYYVKMYYRNDTKMSTPHELSLPDCHKCTLETFTKKTAHVIPGDYDTECSVTPLPCAPPNPVVKSSCQGLVTAIVIVSLLVFLGLVAFVVRHCQRRRAVLVQSQFHQVQGVDWDSD